MYSYHITYIYRYRSYRPRHIVNDISTPMPTKSAEEKDRWQKSWSPSCASNHSEVYIWEHPRIREHTLQNFPSH